MISTLMLVGLGFFSASLVAILIVPWVWRRAVKVTGKRLQFAAPDSVIEVQADRDQLRAEHALSTRKLELRLQDIKGKLSRQAVEHSENVKLTEQLQVDLEDRDAEIAKRDTEIEQMRASMSPIETELASRTSTVQQLRETIRRLEDKVREQETMIKQTVEAAGLKEAEIEALREASRQEDAGKILLPGLDSTRETLTEQVGDLAKLAREMETQRQNIFEQQEKVEKQRGEIASSKTISAQEAKEYQGQISALEAERGKLDADLKDAIARAAALRGDVGELDVAWQNRDNPYAELKSRMDTIISEVERISKTLNRESIVKSVLAALPGGKSAAKKQEPYALPPVAIVPDPAPREPKPEPALPMVVGPQPEQKPAPVQLPVAELKSLPKSGPESEPESSLEPDLEPDTEPQVVRLPETKPAPALPSAAGEPAKPPALGPTEPPALEPAKKSARTRTRSRRVRSLAERIRALQEEMS